MSDSIDSRAYSASCLCLAVRRAARALGRRYDEALREFGINSGQLSILMALAGSGKSTFPQLSAELVIDRTTLTAALKPLERDGLIVVRPDPVDRRARQIGLTPTGRARLETALPRWRRVQAQTLKDAKLYNADPLRAALAALTAASETGPTK